MNILATMHIGCWISAGLPTSHAERLTGHSFYLLQGSGAGPRQHPHGQIQCVCMRRSIPEHSSTEHAML